jgi:hypothetical protein
MKRSTKVLIAALAIPALISLVVGVRVMNNVIEGSAANAGSGKGSFKELFDRVSGPLPSVYDNTVPVTEELRIVATATQIQLEFSPDLNGSAHIKVESATPELVEYSLTDRELRFAPKEGGKTPRITVAIPTTFKNLALEFAASRCELKAAAPISIVNFEMQIDASACELRLNDIANKDWRGEFDASQVDVSAAKVASSAIDWRVNAGLLEFRAADLAFTNNAGDALNVAVNTGNAEIKIESAPNHSIRAAANMANVKIRRGDSEEAISGVTSEKTISGPEGSPTIRLEANMGNLDFAIAKLL